MSIEKELENQRKFYIEVREKRNLSQSQFALAIGIVKGFVSKSEAKNNTRPANTYIEALSKVLTDDEKKKLLSLITKYYKELLKLK